jgi:hypothetical protein
LSSESLKKTAITTILLTILLSSPLFIDLPAVEGQNFENTTLADTIKKVLGNIRATDSSWNVVYGQVLGLQTESVFDEAILQALGSGSYGEVIFIARLAEINRYSSEVVNESVRAALMAMPMVGSYH